MSDSTSPSPSPTADLLTDLLALCVKYGVTIDGCGCCGSPWVRGLDINLNILEVNSDTPDTYNQHRLVISQGGHTVSAEVVGDEGGKEGGEEG